MLFESCKITSNPKFAVSTIKCFNDGVNNTVVSATINYLVEVEAVTCYLSVKVQANKNDDEYTKEFLKARFDMSKFAKGIFANPLARVIAESAFKSMNFEWKYPLPPVSTSQDMTI